MDWEYHGKSPNAGRKLLLLQEEEVLLTCPLIYRNLSLKNIRNKASWFSSEVTIHINDEAKLLADLNLYNLLYLELKTIIEVRKNKSNKIDFLNSLEQLNYLLNQFFSDFGWRQIRKEISQIKKRQKKGHIEVSKDIIFKLKRYMELERFDSFDQALDTLLSDHKINDTDK